MVCLNISNEDSIPDMLDVKGSVNYYKYPKRKPLDYQQNQVILILNLRLHEVKTDPCRKIEILTSSLNLFHKI